MGNDNLYMFDIGSRTHTELNLPEGQGPAIHFSFKSQISSIMKSFDGYKV